MEDPGLAMLKEQLEERKRDWLLALRGKGKTLLTYKTVPIALPKGIRNILAAQAECEGTSISEIVVDSLLIHLGIPATAGEYVP